MNEEQQERFPRVSIVTAIYNRIAITRDFLRHFVALTYPAYELVIVDDGSTDGSADAIEKEFPQVRLIRTSGNLWWSKAMNVGVRDALQRGAEFVLSMNDDVIPDPEFLTHLMRYAMRHPRTLVGATIYTAGSPNEVWYAGGSMGWLSGRLNHRVANDARPPAWLTGMGTLIPADAFREVGYYDEDHFPQYAGDVDFSLRARKSGFALAVVNESRLWNKADESVQRLIRLHVTFRNFLFPLFTRKSDTNLHMRLALYRRHWPIPLVPIAVISYYAVFFAKQSVRLARRKR